MIIQFKKGGRKPTVLNCFRDNDTSTWSKLHRGMETHDLAHYAVETILEFEHAFYGIVNQGFDIKDFELPMDKKPLELQPSHIDVSAIQTEHIVNLLQIEFFNAGQSNNFIHDLKEILIENNLPFPAILDEHKLENIRQMFSDLLYKWGALNEGEILELTFEPKQT